MLDATHQRELVQRLRRIEGQVRGIERMVIEPRLCLDILQQLSAVAAAVERVRVGIIRYHVKKCVPAAIRQGGVEQTRHLDELSSIVDQFCK
jgi:DNA-binding FrmR family transcriptional regulator